MLAENSDEPFAKEISRAVMQELKKGNEVSTTTQLRRVIEKALIRVPEKEREEVVKKSCQRTFRLSE